MSNLTDKAGEAYWEKVWSETELSPKINIHTKGINSYPYRVLHGFYTHLFKNVNTKGLQLLEIGCGNSSFLTYFAEEFGFKISGIDYSELGCEQSKRIFQRDDINGTIYFGDAFSPPPELLGKFDVVCSFGVVEHFTDTVKALQSFTQFVKPGGILITSVPNLAGATGFLQRIMNKPVYDIHVPMDKKYLDDANEKAGLELLQSRYFVSVSFAVTLEGIDGKPISSLFIKKIFLKTIRYFSKVIWLLENLFVPLPETKTFSAGIITAARKTNSVQ